MNIPPVIYERCVRPVLFLINPETIHEMAMFALSALSRRRLLLKLISSRHDPRLEKTVFGVKFPNPIGLAAGFDKNAVALPAWQALGFGFIEADGHGVYFHRNSVVGGHFERLRVGSRVRFTEEEGEKGPQASTVRLVRPARQGKAAAATGVIPHRAA